MGQFLLVYVCATDEDIHRIIVRWLWSTSGSRSFGGRRLPTMLRPAKRSAMASSSRRALLFSRIPCIGYQFGWVLTHLNAVLGRSSVLGLGFYPGLFHPHCSS